ncbi:unnamed protein product, partial [Prorocentrum cordatum]
GDMGSYLQAAMRAMAANGDAGGTKAQELHAAIELPPPNPPVRPAVELQQASAKVVKESEKEAARKVHAPGSQTAYFGRATMEIGTAPSEGFRLQLSFSKLFDGVELQDAHNKMVEETSKQVNSQLQAALEKTMGSL